MNLTMSTIETSRKNRPQTIEDRARLVLNYFLSPALKHRYYFYENILLLHSCVLFYQFSELGQGLPRQLRLFHQTFLGVVNMTVGNARDTETLMEIGIRICNGDIQEYCVGIGRCQFVIGRTKSVTCLCERKETSGMCKPFTHEILQ